jgi:hypothetical protein
MRSTILSCLTAFALSSCVGPPQEGTPPIQPQASRPIVTPVPAPAPARPIATQPQGHWTDWPTVPGAWIYRSDDRGSVALYGAQGGDAIVTLRCDKGRGRIYLSRAGNASGTMTVRTSSTSKAVTAQSTGGNPPYAAVELMPTDPLLDAMAYSRGRIALELSGVQNIAIPVWSEIGRITEDCR